MYSRVLMICLLGMAVSIWVLMQYAIQTRESREIQKAHLTLMSEEAPAVSDAPVMPVDAAEPTGTPSAQPIAMTPAPQSTRTPAPTVPAIQQQFRQLYAQNTDFAGWLKVNCLYRINFAVVRGKNSFYIDHDFDQKENVNGTAFLDETCSLWPRDDNLIVYAHNMRSGDMFGELNQMMQESTLRADPTVQFDTLYEQGVYIPVAVLVCSVGQGEDYFQFYIRNFRTEQELENYVARAKELSGVLLATDVRYGDQLLTLTTCYDRENTKRLVVLLRKLRDDEDAGTVSRIVFP